MMRLLIARHGNTFSQGEVVRRVGTRTDIPLSASGCKQAEVLGAYLARQYADLAAVFVSELQRTQQTAQIALKIAAIAAPITTDAQFNEIDYGPDENQPESSVVARIGQAALIAWEKQAIVPEGWQINPELVYQQWQQFAAKIRREFADKTILVVTSNGIARFALYALLGRQVVSQLASVKMPTGSISELVYKDHQWSMNFWGRI